MVAAGLAVRPARHASSAPAEITSAAGEAVGGAAGDAVIGCACHSRYFHALCGILFMHTIFTLQFIKDSLCYCYAVSFVLW